MASYGLPAQAKATPRPDPLLFLGGPACRSPGIRSQRAAQGHINGFLWASSAGKSYPQGQIHCFFWAVQRARHSQPPGIPRPHPWLFMGVQACRLPALKRLKRSKRLKPRQGHINGCLWASSAGKSYPKARSIAFSGRSSVPLARHSQPTGIPRPHPWLFMGVQACRLPALKRLKRSKPLKPLKGHIHGFFCLPAPKRLKRSKRLKPLQGHINGFLWASSAGKSYPKARSIAFSGRSSVPVARHSQPPGIPRPHPWLFMGVQACRLPALKRLKRSKPLKPLKGHIHGFFCLPAPKRLKRSKRLKPLKGHINGFFWASKLAVKT